ncbi:secreted RxLR effector protein 161-like [Impatiens glandulifera]|uniref:secreted RxLR effector protein 161-like n=1 Tax=Impatiens glandulifera TaxID=253017 RepID=UPI001FB0FE5C|nr:secreted RxLR effector protein 161-like [Impatiens glandulifera]
MELVAHFDMELHQMEQLYGATRKLCVRRFKEYGLQIKEFHLWAQTNVSKYPVAKGDKFNLQQCPKGNLEIQEMQKVPYASVVGNLMCAQVCTRPDIAYIIGVLGKYLSNPGLGHWEATERVMRYLKRTRSCMLTYRRSDNLEIIGYSDSDFAGCQDSLRSTSGYVFLLAGGAISWKSSIQGLTASSTMAAEFVALYEASNQEIWLKNFVTELRILKGIERSLRFF